MAALLDKIASTTRPLVWLDDLAYSARLLAAGRVNWLDSAELVAFRRKAAGLLRPELTVLPVDAVAGAWLDASPDLRLSMTVRQRAVVPLRTLLADPGFRGKLEELARALRTGLPGRPLVLSLPSPRRWIADAYRDAFGPEARIEVGAAEVDTAAVYVAEFLRSFGETGVDGVLLREAAGSEAISAEEIAWYQPVINIAGHYRWDLGLQFADGGAFAGNVKGLSYAIAARPLAGCVAGMAVAEAFWSGAPAPAVSPGGFLFTAIPPEVMPEQVLDRLKLLRGEA